MGTSMKSQGEFYFSKGKMRLEMREPERTTLVYDGKIIWFESRADEEHIVVTKMKAMELRKSDSLLASLFDRKDVLKNFNLKSSKSEWLAIKDFKFEPKDKKEKWISNRLEIALKDKKTFERISYKDQIEQSRDAWSFLISPVVAQSGGR